MRNLKKSKLYLLAFFLFCFSFSGKGQSAYFGGKGDGYSMATTGQITLGTKQNPLKSESIDITPNPVPSGEKIKLEGLNQANHAFYRIVSNTGKMVKEGKLNSQTLDSSNIPHGIHVFLLYKRGEVIRKKLVITPSL